jgi:hypothetical protein
VAIPIVHPMPEAIFDFFSFVSFASFVVSPSSSIRNWSHGWLGNPTDERPVFETLSAWQFLSVGLPSHPWDYHFQ